MTVEATGGGPETRPWSADRRCGPASAAHRRPRGPADPVAGPRPARRGPRPDLPRRPAGLEGARRPYAAAPRRCAPTPRRPGSRSTCTRRTWSTSPRPTTGSASRRASSSSSTPTRPRRSARRGLIVHGGHVTADDDPEVGFDNWRKAFERLRARAADPHREHRRRRPRDGPPARRDRPALGRARTASTSASAWTPATPGRAAIELVDARRPGQGDHRPDRPGARQRQQGRVRLRARPARQPRRRAHRPATLVAVVARRRCPGRGARRPAAAGGRAPTSRSCASGCRGEPGRRAPGGCAAAAGPGAAGGAGHDRARHPARLPQQDAVHGPDLRPVRHLAEPRPAQVRQALLLRRPAALGRPRRGRAHVPLPAGPAGGLGPAAGQPGRRRGGVPDRHRRLHVVRRAVRLHGRGLPAGDRAAARAVRAADGRAAGEAERPAGVHLGRRPGPGALQRAQLGLPRHRLRGRGGAGREPTATGAGRGSARARRRDQDLPRLLRAAPAAAAALRPRPARRGQGGRPGRLGSGC